MHSADDGAIPTAARAGRCSNRRCCTRRSRSLSRQRRMRDTFSLTSAVVLRHTCVEVKGRCSRWDSTRDLHEAEEERGRALKGLPPAVYERREGAAVRRG